jgi:hypothetical protein
LAQDGLDRQQLLLPNLCYRTALILIPCIVIEILLTL